MSRFFSRTPGSLALAFLSILLLSTFVVAAHAEQAPPSGASTPPLDPAATPERDELRDESEDEARTGEIDSHETPTLSADKDPPKLPLVSTDALQTMSLPIGGSKSGVSSQSISVPQGAGKIAGMGESFSAQLSTGIGTFNLPFALPPARGAAQPSLALSYSSSGGHGLAGVGWDLGVPFISRQTDRGVPSYADPAPGGPWAPTQDRFVFNGGQELVPICLVTTGGGCLGAQVGEVIPAGLSGWQYFRPRIEGLFMRFFWSPDHRTWLVQSKSGVTMELGVPLDGSSYSAALETSPSNPTRIFRWNIAREYDPQVEVPAPPGSAARPVNLVAFRYMVVGGSSYLTDVYDTPPASGAADADVTRYAHHARIAYEARTDPMQSFRRGWAVTQGLRISGLDVTSKSFSGNFLSRRELLRRYHLAYEPGYHVTLLSSVTVEGRCDSPVLEDIHGALPAVTGCLALPPARFEYQHVAPFAIDGQPASADLPGFEGFDERVLHFGSSPAYSLDGSTTDLFDVNADGLPDVLVTQPALFQGKHGVFFNGAQGQPNTFGASTIGVVGVLGANAGTIVLSNTNIAPQDLDGDGVIDLLHMPQVKTYSVYTPVKGATGWDWIGRVISTAAAQNPKIDFVNHDADIKVMDVDGDGLVDVVFSAGTEMQTFFALGRYQGGDGQFGHPTWTGAGAPTISNNPVTSCLPWSATAVKLSDPDVRLADMNGDGFPDIVRVRKGQIQYWPGRGNGFWGTGAIDDCLSGSFGQGRHIAMTASPQFTAADGPPRLDDVNGDGLADLVQVRFNAVDIWLNVDGVGWTADRHVIHNTPPVNSIQAHVRLADANGSGTRDILWGDASDYKYIDLLGGKQPWVLTHVANGLGKTTDLEFSTSTELMLAAELAGAEWQSKAPSPIHVVTRVTEHDNLEVVGRPAGTYVTEYSYSDPVYDGRQREFRGFRTGVAKRLGDANSPTSVARSSFLLGECKDEMPLDGIDPCSVGERWRDNPREALKGLPTVAESFDENGTYVSTTHETYRLRQLYTGLDGREVRHAFAVANDVYLYDTGPFVPASSTTSLPEVELELETAPGAIVSEPLVLVTLRASVEQAHTRTAVAVDPFGNATDQMSFGCLAGCPFIDETITAHSLPGRPAGDPTGWLWRTVESYTTGSNNPLVRRGRTFLDYDAMGNLLTTSAELLGTHSLDRFHEDPAKTVAPAPSQASNDGVIALDSRVLDSFGNVRARFGANGHCSSTEYDDVYAQLATQETQYAGELVDGCGSTLLTTSAVYDRGMGAVTTMVGVRGEVTTALYDGFGRILEAHKPHPTLVGTPSVLPSVKFDYFPTLDAVGEPYSRIRMQTQDGVDQDDPSYRTTWSYVDGLGRSIVTFGEADPSAGDGGAWIASGLDEYDAKGAVSRRYEPWFDDGDPELFDLATMPATSFSQAHYDAFGRVTQSFGLDGEVTLETSYHALSSDAWDAEDLAPGSHHGTPASARKDGHGRQVGTTERVHVGAQIEEHDTRIAYLPTGEVAKVTRVRVGTVYAPVVRWMRYDSLGRMVLNVDPNTTSNFTSNPNADPSSFHAWRYAYDDAGDLVGTSDARGCGVNYDYDAAGRPLIEDYSPCRTSHADYSAPDAEGVGAEVFYLYDEADPAAATIPGFPLDASLLKGRLASVTDRASKSLTRYDRRGRVTGVARRIAKPGPPNDDPKYRFAPRWYKREISFDGADRPVTASTGAAIPELLGGSNDSIVSTVYSKRGEVKSVGGSYGTLVSSVTRDADGRVLEIVYGDLAQTTTTSSFDVRRRLLGVQTYRATPPAWSASPPSYVPAPDAASGTLQLLLEDLGFTYDRVDNPSEIRDYRNENEWPHGAKPVYRSMQYDDLYRLSRIDYLYQGGDDWVSPFDAEDNGGGTDPRRATPSPHVEFQSRVGWQTFAYDWLGNTAQTEDDAGGFHDRSLGNILQGNASDGPYQIRSAGSSQATPRAGNLSTAYDAAGNLTTLAVRRDGPCLPAGASCMQVFDYEWDEVGRLGRARRWDMSLPPTATDPLPTSDPAVDLRYAYDASDMRVLKTAVASKEEIHTAYVFDSLELRRTPWLEDAVDPELSDYEDGKSSEVPYLSANGVRLARISFGDDGVPGADLHVFLELADHLGSNGIVIDKATGELVERTTYQAYGATESDYRPERWNSFREDYRFTGKEEDVEVGLTYFGARYYASALGRWISPDPLAVHALGADLNLYAYVHGSVLRAVDPLGLSGEDENGNGGVSGTNETGECSGCPVEPAAVSPAPATASRATPEPAAVVPRNAAGGYGGAPALPTAAGGVGGGNVSGTDVIVTPEDVAEQARLATAIPRMGVHAVVDGFKRGPVAAVEDFTVPQAHRTIKGEEQFVDPYAGQPLWLGVAKQIVGASQTPPNDGPPDGGMNMSGAGDPPSRGYDRPHPETFSGVAINDAIKRWNEFLGPHQTNIDPRDGLPDPDRIWSTDGKRSIRFSAHEMGTAPGSNPKKFHFHEETWEPNEVKNVVRRVPQKK